MESKRRQMTSTKEAWEGIDGVDDMMVVMLMIMNLEGRQRDLSLLKDGDQIEPNEGEAGAGVHQEKRSGDHHWLEEPLCQKKSRSQPDVWDEDLSGFLLFLHLNYTRQLASV